ncbi:MAG: transporter permease [Bacteroidetes bacterium]|nr:transporter permease [Bacteroidota bacterium]
MILLLSWKNIWRNKLRSIIIITSVILGLVAGIFVVGFMNGWVKQKIDSVIEIEIPHLQINSKTFIYQNDIENNFDISILEKKILQSKRVKALSPRIIINTMISSAHKVGGVQVYGIDPVKEKMVSDIYKNITKENGNYFNDNKPYSIVIGAKLAKKYQIKLRSKIVLSMVSIDGIQVSSAFRVCGIYDIGNPPFEESRVFVRDKDLREISSLPINRVHETGIRLIDNEISTLEEAKGFIIPLLNKDNKIRTWKEVNAMMGIYSDYMNIELMVIVSIILLGLGFGIVNTVLMSVMERKSELSMLMAIGMSKKKVLQMIILESTILTSFGGFIGMLLGLIIISTLHNTGMDISKSMSSVGEFGFSTMVYPAITVIQFSFIAFMVILTGILSAIYPSKAAMSINPAEGIRQ